jgi:hypothetical protein
MRLLLSSVFILFVSCLFAQDSLDVTVPEDSIKIHSPKKAVIFSAIVPGAGQVYNHIAMPKGKKKAFWKVPLIYAGLGATGYFLIKNQKTQVSLRKEYDYRMTYEMALDPKWEPYDNEGVLTLYNQYLDRRDLSILGFSAVYLIQLIDAGIEAHFVDFDISEDLSLSLEPAYFGKNTVGMGLTLNFR